MQCSRPLQRLLRAPQATCIHIQVSRRCLHATTRHRAEDSPTTDSSSLSAVKPAKPARAKQTRSAKPTEPYTNHLIPQKDLTVIRGRRKRVLRTRSTKELQPYTEEDVSSLKDYYSPQQIAAIRAGEASISPQDIIDQGALHQGHMTLNYLDDFSDHRPVIDKNPEVPGVGDPKTGKMPRFRWKDEDDMVDDLEDWVDEQPADGGNIFAWAKFNKNYRPYDSEVDLSKAKSFVAPEICEIDDPILKSQARASNSRADHTKDPNNMLEDYRKLARQTGFSMTQIKDFQVKFLVTRFVTNQTRLGKARSIYYLTIAGNGNGLLGVGEAKSQEPDDARKKAIIDAIRNLEPVRRYEDRTIYGSVKGKSGATELELHARHPGFGSRCQSLIWEMCKAAGIRDISARVTRSRNPMNIVKATMKALRSQQDPNEIALARGRRMVDLRKVYYAGNNA